MKQIVADLWISLQANHSESARILELIRNGKRPVQTNVELELWDINKAAFSNHVHNRSLRTGMMRAFANIRYIGKACDQLALHPLSSEVGRALAETILARMEELQDMMKQLEPVIRQFVKDEKL